MDIPDSKNFLIYLKEHNNINLNFITNIKFNKKSITIKIKNKDFFFNNLFTEKSLYNLIIVNVSNYLRDNNLNCWDIDYLKYKYQKINIKY